MSCATRAPLTCSTGAPISEPSRSSWDTRRSRPPRCTPRSRRNGCARCTSRHIRAPRSRKLGSLAPMPSDATQADLRVSLEEERASLRQQLAGRLTLNPLAHVDLFGTLLLPALLILTTGRAFGYAKPVPVNPSQLRNPRNESLLVSLAGPAVNIVIAVVAAVGLHSVHRAG